MTELRLAPRFSINKLAEYLTASPARRRRLILDQINPPTFKTQRYQFALPAAQAFLRDAQRPVSYLEEFADRLRDRASAGAESAHVKKCLLDSARALETFATYAVDLRFPGLLAVSSRRADTPLVLAGMEVSVRPEVYIADPTTELHVGAIKFHTARTAPLSIESLQYAAAILYTFCRSQSDATQAGSCLVVEVFSGRIEPTPRAVKARMKDVNAACEEIVQRWPQLVKIARREAQARSDQDRAQ